MSLSPGTTLGPYQVTTKIGEDGMGEVYQARDTTLDRDVALKVLPEAFTSDPDRLARFQREAKVLASLNHPNIGSIYGLEEAEGVRALVLELIEGPTLADRIAQGPIPLDEALPIAKQIAEALEAAHEAGVIHRDLKPANIKVREDGTVKVLDFGLAKAFQPDASAPGLSQSPTISLTAAATQMGMVIGTAAYMSPEQAKGKLVDKRADIWAFGAVLFEMLTGTRAFAGDDVSEVLASVLAREPKLDALPTTVPPHVRRVLTRCLQKDPAVRLRDIGDARVELAEDAERGTTADPPPAGAPRGWRRVAMVGVAALIVGSVVTGLAVRRAMQQAPAQVSRFLVTPPPEAPLTTGPPGTSIAISRDGSTLAYLTEREGISGLAVRRIDQLEARVFADPQFVAQPFFSPDGASVGLFVLSVGLQRIGLNDGVVRTITELPAGTPAEASWGDDGTIVFGMSGSPEVSGLYEVPAAGGEATRILAVDDEAGVTFLGYPAFLPGDHGLIFTTGSATFDFQLEWLLPGTGERRLLVEGGRAGRYVPTGHLVYESSGVLYAVGFDLDRLEVLGEPVPVVDSVLADRSMQVAVSDTGTLAYLAGDAVSGAQRGLVWVDRQGMAVEAVENRDSWVYPRVASDGRRIAVTAGAAGSEDIWVLDTRRGTRTRLTVDEDSDVIPEWAPDGTQVLFRSGRDGNADLYVKRADGRGEQQSCWMTTRPTALPTGRPTARRSCSCASRRAHNRASHPLRGGSS